MKKEDKFVKRNPPAHPELQMEKIKFRNILKDEYDAVTLKDFVDLCREKKLDLNRVFFDNWKRLNINDMFFVGKQTKKQYLKERDKYEKEEKDYEKWYKENEDAIRRDLICGTISKMSDKELNKAIKIHQVSMRDLKDKRDILGRELAIRKTKSDKRLEKAKKVRTIQKK